MKHNKKSKNLLFLLVAVFRMEAQGRTTKDNPGATQDRVSRIAPHERHSAPHVPGLVP
jgi:hypothetical protein